MKTVGIICEYNPFHNGHQRQLRKIRERLGADTAVVCVMSGDYVQRGAPALYPKEVRAEAAIRGGVNLVLELPVSYALRSAEGFAAGGVEILDGLGICEFLSFGCERVGDFRKTAELLDSGELQKPLHEALDAGLPFPAARQKALEAIGGDGVLLTMPNTTLAVEYAKALRRRGSGMELLPILRDGDYHAETPDAEQPSASALRACENFLPYVPEETRDCYRGEPQYRPEAGERAVLARLRGLTEKEFSEVPFGSEGLWRKVYRACSVCESTEAIIRAAKSKRYAYTRLSRLILCAYLGITEAAMAASAPYVRVLGFDAVGQRLLKRCRETGAVQLLNAGQTAPESDYARLERRCRSLYGLFRAEDGGLCTGIRKERVFSAEKMKKVLANQKAVCYYNRAIEKKGDICPFSDFMKEVNTMKEGIHPKYEQTTIRCACGEVIATGSTKKDIKVEICSKCHPFFTGKQKLVDTGGRVDRFNKKYGLK